jgi:predicted nucleotidyltransferase
MAWEMSEMTVPELQEALVPLRDMLREQKVAELFVFGSVARGEATSDSDIDILVSFSEPVGLFHFLRLRAALADALGHSVDLVTPDALKPAFRETILKEAVRAA